jgi:NitT/TauT family transport system substrate-binding protein
MEKIGRDTVRQSRRRFVQAIAGTGLAVASGSLLAGCTGQTAPFFSSRTADQLETTRIRVANTRGLCNAPQVVAGEQMRAEGFTDVQYVGRTDVSQILEVRRALAEGDADISMNFTALNVMSLDASESVVILGGIHVGCFELFGNDQIRAIRDLKGKTVALAGLGTGSSQHVFLGMMLAYVGLDPINDVHWVSSQHVFLGMMLAYVGLDPINDVHWVTQPFDESRQLLADGKVDAFLGFPPESQIMRASGVGHVVVNSAQDRPWSQYFCCTVVANRAFVQQHPVAARHALRAMLKATDFCVSEPERAAQALVDQGSSPSYDVALQAMRELPYRSWREYDAEDAVRFWSLRLHEAGMIKSSPEQIISKGTNWQFFNELKQELKA